MSTPERIWREVERPPCSIIPTGSHRKFRFAGRDFFWTLGLHFYGSAHEASLHLDHHLIRGVE